MTTPETPDQIAHRFRIGDATETELLLMASSEIAAPVDALYDAPCVFAVHGYWFFSVEKAAGHPKVIPVSAKFAEAWISEFASRT